MVVGLFMEEVQSDWGQKGKKEGFEQGDKTYKICFIPLFKRYKIFRIPTCRREGELQRGVDNDA